LSQIQTREAEKPIEFLNELNSTLPYMPRAALKPQEEWGKEK